MDGQQVPAVWRMNDFDDSLGAFALLVFFGMLMLGGLLALLPG